MSNPDEELFAPRFEDLSLSVAFGNAIRRHLETVGLADPGTDLGFRCANPACRGPVLPVEPERGPARFVHVVFHPECPAANSALAGRACGSPILESWLGRVEWSAILDDVFRTDDDDDRIAGRPVSAPRRPHRGGLAVQLPEPDEDGVPQSWALAATLHGRRRLRRVS